MQWKNGLSIDDPILQFQLFRNSEFIDIDNYRNVSWSILNNGLTSKYWRTNAVSSIDGDISKKVILDYNKTKSSTKYTNYIIKGQANLPIDEENYQTYYSFYPICTKTKYAAAVETEYSVTIDKDRTLRQVVYNSDGRNPLYDKNLGIGLTFKNLTDENRTIVWEPHGGIIEGNYNEDSPSFSLGKTISCVPAYQGNIKDYIADLEEEKAEKKEAYINGKKNNNKYIEDIKQELVGIKNDINQQISNINNELNEKQQGTNESLIEQRDRLWNEFVSQRIKDFNTVYNKLNTSFTSKNQKIEDYIYTSDAEDASRYYEEGQQGNTFKNQVLNYINIHGQEDGKERNKTFDSSLNDSQNDQSIFTDDILIQLSLNLVDFPDANNEYKQAMKAMFKTLLNIVVIGYKTYLSLYDNENKDLYNKINQLIEEYEDLIVLQDKYNTIDFINDIDEKSEQIKKIIFENSENYSEINQLLLDIILSIKQQYKDYIFVEIEQPLDNQINFLKGTSSSETDPTFCSIIPNDVYSGEYPNQYVRILIYKCDLEYFSEDAPLEYEIIVPFHMSLNLYGLASLNGWDGNSVEINEDEGYMLAPQIGAGKKHLEDNTFTGILMGTEKTYDDDKTQEETGLFGYSHGKRSIFLDAATGNATFGLPENDAADISNPLTEGRIELRPGGISSISKWKFDSRSLYRVASEQETELLQAMQTRRYENETSIDTLVKPYDDAPQYAHGSIPHTQQGILLSALPAYVSFKGRQLNEQDHKDHKVNYLNLNTTVREGDSFELQIDPNDAQFFTLYEHSSRLTFGQGYCDKLGNFINTDDNPYALTPKQICTYFDKYITYTKQGEDYQNIHIKEEEYNENDYIICQQYYNSVAGGSIREFRVISILKWFPFSDMIKERGWILEQPLLNKQLEETNEYVIGECKQYREWSGSNPQDRVVWKFISFNQQDEVPKITECIVDNNELVKLLINEEEINNRIWNRYRKAGIDATGKFTAESVGLGSIGMGLGTINAFKPSLFFLGTSIEQDDVPLIQFFIDQQETVIDDGPVYISSSKDLTGIEKDEGKRPIKIYAGRKSGNQDFYQEAFGSDWYKTGIFVGRTTDKNPTKKISKIELWQTTDDDNNIILSAIGSNSQKESTLTLKSNGLGSLIHTNNWKTEITGDLTKTIKGNVIKTINQKLTETIEGDITQTVNGKISQSILHTKFSDAQGNNTKSGKINLIAFDKDYIWLRHRVPRLRRDINNTKEEVLYDDNQFKLTDNSIYSAYQQIHLIGGQNYDKSSQTQFGMIIDAKNTSYGLLMRASTNNMSSSSWTTNVEPGQDTGGVIFYMRPSNSITTAAKFKIWAGGKVKNAQTGTYNEGNNGVAQITNDDVGTIQIMQHLNVVKDSSNILDPIYGNIRGGRSYIWGDLTVHHNTKNPGGNIVTDKSITAKENIYSKNGIWAGSTTTANWTDGQIHGSGTYIKNTSDAGSNGAAISFAPSFGSSSTHNISYVTRDSNGRPEIAQQSMTVALPSLPNHRHNHTVTMTYKKATEVNLSGVKFNFTYDGHTVTATIPSGTKVSVTNENTTLTVTSSNWSA